jgi:malate dehydrogenase
MKIAVIGAGNVGSQSAMFLAQKQAGEIVLLDVVRGLAAGKALDINHALALENRQNRVRGSEDYRDIADAGIIIITAGIPRGAGNDPRRFIEK